MGKALVGQVDIDESGYGLDGMGVLGVVEKVALAGLIFGVPLEDVELGVIGMLGRWGGYTIRRSSVIESRGSVSELRRAGTSTSGRVIEVHSSRWWLDVAGECKVKVMEY